MDEIKKPDQTFAGCIEIYDDVVKNYDEILETINKENLWDKATVEEGIINNNIRNNDVAFFNPFDFRNSEILYSFAKVVWNYVNVYALKHEFSFSNIENVNINRYKKDQEYHAHCDDGPGISRIVSALVYLNEVESGGETEFVYFNKSISPKPGRLVIFPSNYAYKHAALPPKKGIKYSAAFWFGK